MNSLTSAVAAVIQDPAGRLLLCQQSQGHRLWGLPGGRIRLGESPLHAAVRDIREETGTDVEIIDLVGLYQLTGPAKPDDELPDVLVHVFRARLDGEATVNAPGRICRLSWHDRAALPSPMTPTTRRAVADAVSGRSGVLGEVRRDAEPEVPEAIEIAQAAAALATA
ncbi:MAG: NUDIX hydrolase [Micromonosporaceae bacterium]|nr:NUDIX hydrolase [Micromonosporaceae bacterium]